MRQKSSNQIINCWEKRYIPDLSTFVAENNSLDIDQLINLTSSQGRIQTVTKVRRILEIKCEVAGIKSNILFSYIPNVIKLADSAQLAKYIQLAYDRMLEIYQQQSHLSVNNSLVSRNLSRTVDIYSDIFKQWVMPAIRLPATEYLAKEIKPAIAQLRQQHLSTEDSRAIGFVSTQFHFSTTFILSQLKLAEQVLLSPYFKFVEEQVCIPWQRVCGAALGHSLDSPKLTLVQQLLPASREIALRVHSRAAQLHPNHYSRRGKLNDPGVKASSIRDIEMFQAYLWLCVLEGSMAAVEQELLPLCTMVFPCIDVQWELVEQITPLLLEEFRDRLEPEQLSLLLPYTQAMQGLFSSQQSPKI
ncbi:hypothetical protein [Lyngbya aestuarii]|uniref:hypothetical protein n=1 Tax=Lyngbya aestuarii TaxID=118322 RepID=UPI00403D56CD